MSDRLDRLTELLDASTQTSTETGYGTDLRPDLCARCQRHAPEDGDLCGGCRAFLLGDADVDPVRRSGPYPWSNGDSFEVVLAVVADAAFLDAMDRLRHGLDPDPADVERLADAFRAFSDAVVVVVRPIVDWAVSNLGDFARTLADSGVLDMSILDETVPPSLPTVRDRERLLLDERRRSHRRTNRWGPPPGRG